MCLKSTILFKNNFFFSLPLTFLFRFTFLFIFLFLPFLISSISLSNYIEKNKWVFFKKTKSLQSQNRLVLRQRARFQQRLKISFASLAISLHFLTTMVTFFNFASDLQNSRVISFLKVFLLIITAARERSWASLIIVFSSLTFCSILD